MPDQSFVYVHFVLPLGFLYLRGSARSEPIRAGMEPEEVKYIVPFQKAMEYGVSRGWRHFFYGASQQTLDNLKVKLEVRYPGIKIVGTYAPEFAQDPALPLGKTECDFFWVGLGCPKQEIWCEKHAEDVNAAAVLAVGAVLDFFGGASPKIPRLIDKLDLCWLWRIFTGGRKTLRRDFYCVLRAALVLLHEFICMRISNHRKRG